MNVPQYDENDRVIGNDDSRVRVEDGGAVRVEEASKVHIEDDAPIVFHDENGDTVELFADSGELKTTDSAGTTTTLS